MKKIDKDILFNNMDFNLIIKEFGLIKKYNKGEIIKLMGDEVNRIGIILDGYISINQLDSDGNEVLVNELQKDDIFLEVFVVAKNEYIPVNVLSFSDTNIIFLDYHQAKLKYPQIIENMAILLANKTINMNKRVQILSQLSLRSKIMTFLNFENKNNEWFEIMFNREELALYLNANRSSLSKELSKMQEEGLIEYRKNLFRIKKTNKI